MAQAKLLLQLYLSVQRYSAVRPIASSTSIDVPDCACAVNRMLCIDREPDMCLSAFGTYINILPLRERLKIIQFRQCLSSYCFYKARELYHLFPCSLYSEELCRKQEQRCALLPLIYLLAPKARFLF